LFHKNVTQDQLNNRATYKVIEKQAGLFASFSHSNRTAARSKSEVTYSMTAR
jgi:hypothetical protein